MRTALPAAGAARARESALGIEAVLVVHLPLLGVAQNVVGFLDVLEAVLGRFVAGVEIRVMLARQFPVGFANFIHRSTTRHSQGLVVVMLRSGWHNERGQVRRLPLRGYFLSSSTNSASTTLSLSLPLSVEP